MSATFKNAKKKLTQQELRKLMNEQKGIMKQNVKKIESPLAKYTETGQLMCILCKSIVRSEAVWLVHVNAKQHKDNIALAKRLKEQENNANKRPLSPTPDVSSKKPKSILKNPLPSKSESEKSQIPDDFFDSKKPTLNNNNTFKPNLQKTKNAEPMEVDPAKIQNSDVPLPEGFFDDPIKDAKARNLEYKDPIEEEWEKFMKEMKEVESTSEAIIAEDQEEATTERQIDEIDEQIRNWARVLDLERKKEQLKKQATEEEMRKQQEESSGEETDFDEYLDWRAKNSFK